MKRGAAAIKVVVGRCLQRIETAAADRLRHGVDVARSGVNRLDNDCPTIPATAPAACRGDDLFMQL